MSKDSGVLLAIPARGGSKRLARKNLLPLAGKPMLVHTIEAARASGLSDQVYVCTEDHEIAKVAEKFGCLVHLVPPELTEDLVSSTTPCLHLAESLIRQGKKVEFLFNLQPSSPLRTSEDIKASFKVLQKSEADYLVSTTPIDPHYFHWALTSDDQKGWKMYFGSQFMKERPLLPPVMRPNGAIKLARYEQLKITKNFFGSPLAVFAMPEERSIHVATRFDYVCTKTMIGEA